MTLAVLFGIIAVQILTFQFAAVRLARRLPDYLVGCSSLPIDVDDKVKAFRTSTGSLRYVLGALLLLAAALVTWMLPLSTPTIKLTLAAISGISSVAFVGAYVHDRSRLSALAAELPEPAVRSASLRGPQLGLHYSPAWEMLPLLIFFATAVATSWALVEVGHAGADHLQYGLLVLPLVQGAFVFAALAFTLWNVRAGSRLSQRAKAFMGTPAQAVEIEESLKQLDLRFFMAVKILVALLLTTMQVEQILDHLGRPVPLLVGLSSWALVLLLLLLFAAFVGRASIVARRTLQS